MTTAPPTNRRYPWRWQNGKAYCWGWNIYGELGDNTTTDSKVPVAVSLKHTLVTAIAAGYAHTVALGVLVATVPDPPTAVSGEPGMAKVAVSWSPPADDGGSPVLDYTATASPGGASCTTAGTSCEVSGLANGTGYTFTVTARNAVGVSAPSAPSASVTPTAATISPPPVQPPQPVVPGKVTGAKAVLRKGTVKVTWKASANATSYRVRISKPGGKKYKAWKITTKRVFKAIALKGKKYRFQVAAIGDAGRGPTTTIRFTGK